MSQKSGTRVAIRNLKLRIRDSGLGVLAQLVERLNGIEEVTGSNPVGSTFTLLIAMVAMDSGCHIGIGQCAGAELRKVTNLLLFPCSPQSESLRFYGHENDE